MNIDKLEYMTLKDSVTYNCLLSEQNVFPLVPHCFTNVSKEKGHML